MNLNEGDIVYATCSNIPLCYHVGIVICDNGKLTIYNNTPTVKNIVGGNIVAQPQDVFF